MPGCALSAKRKKRRPKLAGDNKRQFIIPIAILVAVILLDQLTKFWVVSSLPMGQSRSILGEFLQFKLIYNQGGALGTNLGNSAFYLISSLLILLVVLYFIISNISSKIIANPMAAIAGGAIGNIIDRIRLGEVVDFLDFDFFDINILGYKIDRWWTFNIADVGITVGMIILLIHIVFFSKSKKGGIEAPPRDSAGHANGL
jgi:signal peptidase II